jgi:hypothetical protein
VAQATTLRFSPQSRLDSWKSVAGYLGCSARTAQRWFSEYSLPVRRVGSGSGRVFAYVDEVDAWLRSRGHSLVAARPASGASAVLEMPPIGAELTAIQASGARLPFAAARFDRSCELLTIAEKMWNTLSALDLGAITQLYREAIDNNPEDAGAFAGITIALIAGGLFDSVTASSSSAAARFALRQATELDSARAEVRTANAWVRLVLDRDWNGARCDFDTVLGQRRNFAPAVVGRTLLHVADGKLNDAAALLHDFTAQYPLSAPAMIIRCWVEYLAGDVAAARYLIAQVRRAGITGSLLVALDALAIIDPNDPEKSIQPLQALVARWSVHYPKHSLPQGALGYCYAITGREQDALHILDNLTGFAAGRDTEVDYSRALIALGLNDFTAAMHWLRESDYGGSLWSFGFAVDPILAPLRVTPEYQSMAKGFGHLVSEATNLQLACVG